MTIKTQLQLRGALYQGQEEWDDDTSLSVDLTALTGTVICGRQYGPDQPLTFADATWKDATLTVPALHGALIASGAATFVVSADGSATGEVTLDDRYAGKLALRFVGKRLG